jgi:DNA repair exonuclease SbcCD ATPase subunit
MITRLRLQNFRRHADTELFFAPDQQVVLISGGNGSGKCLPGHVRVHDPIRGEMLPIEQFVAERRPTTLGVVDGKVVPVQVSDWHQLGERDTVEIILRDGTRLVAAGTHPVLTDSGCVRAADLTPEHWVAQARRLPESGPTKVSVDEAFLLGMLLGDGSTSTTIQFCNTDPAVLAAFQESLERVFPHLVIRTSNSSSTYRIVSSWSPERRREAILELASLYRDIGVAAQTYLSKGAYYRFERGGSAPCYETFRKIEADYGLDLNDMAGGLYGGRVIIEWARDLGILGTNAWTKRVPSFLLTQPEPQTLALLSGLWQTDGWFSNEMALSSASPGLAEDIRMLLLRVDCVSTIRYKEGNNRICVPVSAATGLADRLTLFGSKAESRAAWLANMSPNRRPNMDSVPPGFQKSLPRMSPSGRDRSAYTQQGAGMGREIFVDFGGDLDAVGQDLTWSRVRSVRPLDTPEECFDLTVDTSEHLYLAESVVVHNSSIIEGISFALWGESRHGKRHLDTLLRRGAEYEGLEVELEFKLGQTSYRVVRRRDSRTSSALLYANDVALVEGPNQVTEEVGRILGMDSAGFRLAVLAQQKELDALTSLQPARRAEQIARLLRLDAITAAKDKARHTFRIEKEVVRSLGASPDVPALAAVVSKAETDLAGLAEAAAASVEQVALFDAELAATAHVEDTYRRAHEAVARCEGALATAQGDAERLSAELDVVVVPPEPTGAGDIDELVDAERDVDRRIHQAQDAQRQAADRQTRLRELADIDAALASIAASFQEHGDPAALDQAAADLDAKAVAVAGDITQAQQDVDTTRASLAALDARLDQLSSLLDTTEGLPAVCETCGQEVSEQHRHDRAETLAGDVATLSEERARLAATLVAKLARLASLETSRDETAARRRTVEGDRMRALGLVSERDGLERRRQVTADIIERLPDTVVDLDALFVERADVSLRLGEARAAADARAARRSLLERQETLEQLLAGSLTALGRARTDLEEAQIDVELEAAFRQRRTLADRREEEHALSVGLSSEVAVQQARLESAKAEVRRAVEDTQRRQEHARTAEVADACSKLLAAVSDHMAALVGPALEGSISEMLSALSDGRFDSARVDADYNISVRDDDGSYHPLGEFSGGEVDLIALAVRLALAAVVAERSGSGGPGFLILDECFGSQDPSRRQSILTSLRGLRSAYGQIFLISHVGGLDDAADLVVDLVPSEDRTELEVTVS